MSDDKLDNDVIQLDVMPGADKMDEDEVTLDMSFEEVEVEVAETDTEEVVAEAETEEVEDSEEATEEEQEETEAEDTAEEPEAELEEPAPAAEEKASKPMVPKSRLDEVLSKQKALQKQLDELNAANKEKEQEAPEEYEFDDKEKEYQEYVLDGEVEKAANLRREIRIAERKQLEFEMRKEMTQTVQQDREMNALQQAAAAMEEAYPVFNRESDQFDEALTNEVVELRNAFISTGSNVVDALGKAVRYVVADKGLDADEQKPSLGASPVDEVAKKRAQISKKLKAAEAQPPELPGESTAAHSDGATNLESMSDDEFDALPAATLARLRGDIV
tara:strand:+ start:2093 stop:3088 length:996 start_codon:yes stop_codon:yes gene_type:complete